MDFEPVLKGAAVSFFDPCATVFWETWGELGANLVPRTRGNNEVGRQTLHTREIVLSGSEIQCGVGRCKRDENSSSC